jgi:hypothetical protein
LVVAFFRVLRDLMLDWAPGANKNELNVKKIIFFEMRQPRAMRHAMSGKSNLRSMLQHINFELSERVTPLCS